MSDDLAFASIPELGRLLRARKLTAGELAELFLERLERFGPRFNCVVTVTPERALAAAARADRDLKAGRIHGPLHGIPFGVKDLLAVAGYPTTWGAEPYRGQTFDTDATVVARLDAAGAVLVAKLAMVELAWDGVQPGECLVHRSREDALEPGLLERRLVLRPRLGRRGRTGAVRHRIRDFRLDPHAVRVLRHHGPASHLWAGEPSRGDGAGVDDG